MVKVKICGLAREGDALFAAGAGADYLGFVLVPSSPRAIGVRELAAFAGKIPSGVGKVGVFANAAIEAMLRAVRDCGLDVVQLHGDETPADCLALEEALGGAAEVWKAVPLVSREAFEAATGFAGRVVVADGERTPPRRGCRHDLAAALHGAGVARVVLAGGLTPDNVADAVRAVRPWCVDVASGVEEAPGVKDPALVAKFIKEAKGRM